MTFQRRFLAFVAIAMLSAACSSALTSPAPSASVAASSLPSPVASASVAPPPAASPSVEPPTPSPTASPAASTGTAPPKPGDPTFDLIKETPAGEGTTKLEYRITWSSPEGVATSFHLYGVTRCLREGKEYDNKPCVVRGMKIPADALELIKKIPGDKRTTTISWMVGELGGGPYAAILIRATNGSGDSIFTIVHSDTVCYNCTY
jgi:hypothetical protein